MNEILVFGASSSKNSINNQFANYAGIKLGLPYRLIDLNDYEMTVFSVDKQYKTGIPQEAHNFKELVKNAKAIIISFAEHNGSYSAAFKNIMDWSSCIEKSRWNKKKMLLLSTSPGKRGGKNVLTHALGYFPHMDAEVIASFSLPSFDENFKNGKITNEQLLQEFNTIISTFKKAIY